MLRAASLVFILSALGAAATPKAGPLEVRVPVWVAGDGQAPPGQWKASVGGSASRVVAVRGPADDLIVLLVLDLVGDLASIEPAKEALAAEIAKLPPST